MKIPALNRLFIFALLVQRRGGAAAEHQRRPSAAALLDFSATKLLILQRRPVYYEGVDDATLLFATFKAKYPYKNAGAQGINSAQLGDWPAIKFDSSAKGMKRMKNQPVTFSSIVDSK